jgi:AraC-like DNA-binding protein
VLFYLEPESTDGRRLAIGQYTSGIQPLDPHAIASVRECVARLIDLAPARDSATTLHDAVLTRLGLEPDRGEPLDMRVVQALHQLREEPAARRSLRDLAKSVGLSPSRLRHLFAEELGMSYRGYVRWLRIYQALLALGEGDSPTGAAHRAGFSDAAHFARSFRRVFGLAPSQISGAVSLLPARSQT